MGVSGRPTECTCTITWTGIRTCFRLRIAHALTVSTKYRRTAELNLDNCTYYVTRKCLNRRISDRFVVPPTKATNDERTSHGVSENTAVGNNQVRVRVIALYFSTVGFGQRDKVA